MVASVSHDIEEVAIGPDRLIAGAYKSICNGIPRAMITRVAIRPPSLVGQF